MRLLSLVTVAAESNTSISHETLSRISAKFDGTFASGWKSTKFMSWSHHYPGIYHNTFSTRINVSAIVFTDLLGQEQICRAPSSRSSHMNHPKTCASRKLNNVPVTIRHEWPSDTVAALCVQDEMKWCGCVVDCEGALLKVELGNNKESVLCDKLMLSVTKVQCARLPALAGAKGLSIWPTAAFCIALSSQSHRCKPLR
jgi:hypothetical protein